jgi:alkanesulfonate monooxygenase SsuD/methylene tetrahydromethanopterin reductase-like flavin-dependent oxidoreductase (luciferase family)
MIGGDGEQRTLRAVAQYADWWNISIRPVPVLRHKLQVLQQYCRDVGRDYASIRKTLKCAVILASSRSEAEQRAEPLLQQGEPLFAGEPAALVDYLHEMVDLGFDLFQLVFDLFPDTSDMRLFVDTVMPHFV